MYSITGTFSFEASHRLIDAYSEECVKNVHGHSYKVRITVISPSLNDDGMVMDFKLLKEWWKENFSSWDHAIFLQTSDPLSWQENLGERVHIWDANPTSENMARKILERLRASLLRPAGGHFAVTVQETEGNEAFIEEDLVSVNKGMRFS